jgi:hypothetical protein
MTTHKPVAAIPPNEQVVKVEDLVFGPGPNAPRCPSTNRRYELGSGALPFPEQTKMFIREAELHERNVAAAREEAERAAAALAAAAAPMPGLRLVKAPAR